MVTSNRSFNMPIVAVPWIALLLTFSGSTLTAHGFSIQRQRQPCHQSSCSPHHYLQPGRAQHIHSGRRSTSLSVIGAGAASILAGSVGGAIGVGVAYPLDTLKTKSPTFLMQSTTPCLARSRCGTVPPAPWLSKALISS